MTRSRVAVVIGLVCAVALAVLVMCPNSPMHSLLRWVGHAVGIIDAPSADPWKPAGDPGEHVVVTGGGSAIWHPTVSVQPGDSIPVTIQVDIGPGLDTASVTIGPDTIPVAIDIEIDGPIYPFRLYGEAAFDGPSVQGAAGASWQPLRLWGASAGPAVSVGLPHVEWVQLGGRVSRPVYSTIDAGAEAGWRLREGPDEPHVGVSLGFCL